MIKKGLSEKGTLNIIKELIIPIKERLVKKK